jgi:pimeloyl-ACP methyl ester carboxylesterase
MLYDHVPLRRHFSAAGSPSRQSHRRPCTEREESTMPDTAIGDPTLDDVKREIVRRAEKRLQPFGHVLAADVDVILKSLASLDRDEWAQAWCKAGLAHEAKAEELARGGAAAKDIGAAFYRAYDYCRIGRYPCASTPGKKDAYRHALRLFRKAAHYFDVPLTVVELPFGDRKLTGYFQAPPGLTRPPVVFQWGGVDGWKEDRQHICNALHRLGLATLVIDMPGTGESPVLYAQPDTERTYSAWIDHLVQRTDVDGRRIGVWGGSFGAYWAARLAHTEAKRLRAAVFHGGNVHYGFQESWLVKAFSKGASTYLFGPSSLLEARSQALGVTTMEQVIAASSRLSLKDMGLLEQPCAALLAVNGKLDDQAPIEDVYLLMEHGSPKCARVYPQGSHMGRTPGMPEDEITRTIAGWLKERLAG